MGALNIIGGFLGLIITLLLGSAIVYNLVSDIQLIRKVKFEENNSSTMPNNSIATNGTNASSQG